MLRFNIAAVMQVRRCTLFFFFFLFLFFALCFAGSICARCVLCASQLTTVQCYALNIRNSFKADEAPRVCGLHRVPRSQQSAVRALRKERGPGDIDKLEDYEAAAEVPSVFMRFISFSVA